MNYMYCIGCFVAGCILFGCIFGIVFTVFPEADIFGMDFYLW
jgi:hypothetical protein